MAQQLAELGKGAGASLPQVLIALIAAYYQRVTGVPDLVFGMPVSGRVTGRFVTLYRCRRMWCRSASSSHRA